MKKLIMSIAIAAVAGIVQAASCTWGSGAIMTAASADGGWGETAAATAGALVTMNIYFVDADTYSSLASKSQQDLFDAYKGGTADLTGQNKNPTSGALINAITIQDAEAAAGVQYAVITATYTDTALAKDFFIAKTTQSTWNAGTQRGTAANLLAGGNWQSVPEPTSGLLMLLGMAGLALRRRRA